MNLRQGMTSEEICERGQRLIDETLSPGEVEKRRGQMVAVDVLTGKMGFGRTGIIADEELRKRVSEPVTYFGRVGHRAAVRMGWSGYRLSGTHARKSAEITQSRAED